MADVARLSFSIYPVQDARSKDDDTHSGWVFLSQFMQPRQPSAGAGG